MISPLSKQGGRRYGQLGLTTSLRSVGSATSLSPPATAFQVNAFQNNAFQIYSTTVSLPTNYPGDIGGSAGVAAAGHRKSMKKKKDKLILMDDEDMMQIAKVVLNQVVNDYFKQFMR